MRPIGMKLLEQIEDRGYPQEYLLSRIRGRRADLIHDWRPFAAEPAPFDHIPSSRYPGVLGERPAEAIWRKLLLEYRWVYRQMNMRIREVFWPFFLYSELRTIFICMRHIKEKKSGKADELLDASLLCSEMKDALRHGDDILKAAEAIERSFVSISDVFKGLSETAASKGLLEFEKMLTNTYLMHVLKEGLHSIIKDFFIRIIDARNIISLYKYLRFETAASPPFLQGGGIDIRRLEHILDRRDIFGLVTLVREITGIDIDVSSAVQVEKALYTAMTRHLRRAGRDPLALGLILDYLWRSSIEAMNLSMIFYLKDLEREVVESELIVS